MGKKQTDEEGVGQTENLKSKLYSRDEKRRPCLNRVSETHVEVWENEKCCGNSGRRREFPQLLRVLPNSMTR